MPSTVLPTLLTNRVFSVFVTQFMFCAVWFHLGVKSDGICLPPSNLIHSASLTP